MEAKLLVPGVIIQCICVQVHEFVDAEVEISSPSTAMPYIIRFLVELFSNIYMGLAVPGWLCNLSRCSGYSKLEYVSGRY